MPNINNKGGSDNDYMAKGGAGGNSKENHRPGSSGGSGRSSLGSTKNGPHLPQLGAHLNAKPLATTGASIVFKTGSFHNSLHAAPKDAARMEIDESSGESIKGALTVTGPEETKSNVFAMADANLSVEDEATACGDVEMEEVCNEGTMRRHPHASGKDIRGEGKVGQTSLTAKFSGPT